MQLINNKSNKKKPINIRIFIIIVLVIGVVIFVSTGFLSRLLDSFSSKKNAAVIWDNANLFSEKERADLQKDIDLYSANGNILILTVVDNDDSPQSYAENQYTQEFGTKDGVVFLIDISNRKIWIGATGACKEALDNDSCEKIATQIATYASKEDYYTCTKTGMTKIDNELNRNMVSSIMAVLLLLIYILYGKLMPDNRKYRSSYDYGNHTYFNDYGSGDSSTVDSGSSDFSGGGSDF